MPSAGFPTFCARQDEEAEGQPLRLVRFPEPRSGGRTPRQWAVAPRHTDPAHNGQSATAPTCGAADSTSEPGVRRTSRSGRRHGRGGDGAERRRREGPTRRSGPGGERTHRSGGWGSLPLGANQPPAWRGEAERLLNAGAGPEYISQGRDRRTNWAGLERLQRRGRGSVAGATERTGPAHAFRAGPGSDRVWAGWGFSAGTAGGGVFAGSAGGLFFSWRDIKGFLRRNGSDSLFGATDRKFERLKRRSDPRPTLCRSGRRFRIPPWRRTK